MSRYTTGQGPDEGYGVETDRLSVSGGLSEDMDMPNTSRLEGRWTSWLSSKRGLEATLPIVGVVAVIYLYVGENAYRQDLAVQVIMFSLLAMGLYLPLILSGSLSLAYNAYYAIGAYSVAIVADRTDWPVYVTAVPIAILVAMALAYILGVATRGLTGFHLAVGTLMVALAAEHFLLTSRAITGGPEGIGNIPKVSVLGLEFGRFGLTLVGAISVCVIALALSRFKDSITGVTLRVQKESPLAVAAAGVSTEAMKILSLCFGAAIASLAGIMLAAINMFILPQSFGLSIVFVIVFMPILGGQSSPWGSVIGAIVVVWLANFIDFFDGPGQLTFGVATLLVLLAAPGGLLGIGSWLIRRSRTAAAARSH